ncbi:hypothetical protein ACETRX_28070 [Labrys portucalensis]|uniref:Spy/CpxP family protein refolding chaperone n=1 Tax=Labrys neptuniae TaxID=376174 RepID=A0ABV6ZMY0_9HYPH|nr:hypothetical protein [Xanthobacter dioxanivorans]
MTGPAERLAELSRMEEARRQIQRQLDLIDRQITRRMTAFIPQLKPRHACHRRGKAPEPSAFLERYRAHLAAFTAERQPEIDALSRKLARQDAAIEAFRRRHGLALDREARPDGGSCHRGGLPPGSSDHRECGHG